MQQINKKPQNFRCKCGFGYECVYDKTDMKMRVYKQACRSKERLHHPESRERRHNNLDKFNSR